MSQERFPPIEPSELAPEQKEAYDHMSTVASKSFGSAYVPSSSTQPIMQSHTRNRFTYKIPSGAFIGPFSPLLCTPSLCKPYFDLVTALSSLSGLPASARETAILVTGSHFQSSYEIYAHERVAASSTSLTKAQISSIKKGKKPEGLDKEAGLAFEATVELLGMEGKKGGLGKERWQELRGTFGEEGTLMLVHYVGLYAYTCVLLNGCDVPVPEGESLW
jgi:4-carboxymuconolactone decarboxylase